MLNIRPIKKEDLDKLAEMYAEVYRVFDVGERWNKESAYKLLKYWFDKQPDLAFLAEDDGWFVGAFVIGIKPWWDGNTLFDGEIFVDPNYQKRGVGSELLKTVFKIAVDKYNVRFCNTITFSGQEHPLSWYKSLGFEEIKEWTMISGDVEKALKILESK